MLLVVVPPHVKHGVYTFLVFMCMQDCHMPEMDGLEATQKIRSCTDRKQPLIVALTASALSHERQRCLAAGMDRFLTKPVRPNDIKELLLSMKRNEHAPLPASQTFP